MSTSTQMVTGVDFVMISTSDIDRARQFYGVDVFGLGRFARGGGVQPGQVGGRVQLGANRRLVQEARKDGLIER